ncbi:hypothetical protein [Clavibacter michiganensis]|uniref:hypothetical protein n=1 Tax=Clavibacter michiganensis TaxID=28447 RepID=UPI0011AFEAC9|nr:hypothetical protein [Clavibacter michiganensis]
MSDPGAAPGPEEPDPTATGAELTDTPGDPQPEGDSGTGPIGVLSETEPPAPGGLGTPFSEFDLPQHHAKTQRTLAFATLGLAGLLYLGAGIFLATDVVSDDQFGRLTAAFSPFTALAAGAIGFYFGKRD